MGQHLGSLYAENSSGRRLGEPGPAAAAAAAAAAGGFDAPGYPAAPGYSAAVAAVPWRSVSTASLLHQLRSNPSLGVGCGAACVRQLKRSAACFGGGDVTAVPASLLLTNYIADVGDRAQQCLGARGQQGAAHTGARARCWGVMQEVEGLLQLSAQPVLVQLLGGQRLHELVERLMRCTQLLADIYVQM